ncbi:MULTISPECIES: hypothetical protein [Kitasatospora]|uniref:hypothetical protein n=1 Tax=Kitasatospora TaxID=2063 RepID=UPI0012FE733E|nr:hypothetical protein [Kitasatospora sp. CB02891]
MATRGRTRGEAQSHRRIKYDPASGNWRTGISLRPASATKIIDAASAAGMSVAGLLDKLIEQMPVDSDGRPILDARPKDPESEEDQQELPLVG